jgi:hypothetical protein
MGDRANFLPTNSAIAYLLNYAVIMQDARLYSSSVGGQFMIKTADERCEYRGISQFILLSSYG